MDCYKSKQVLWLCFWCQTIFPSDLCWKRVYILIFGIIFFQFWLGHFSKILSKIISQIIGGPFEKFLFQKSKCTLCSSINLKGKMSDTKNVVISPIYFCNYPHRTPCTYLFRKYIPYINNTYTVGRKDSISWFVHLSSSNELWHKW